MCDQNKSIGSAITSAIGAAAIGSVDGLSAAFAGSVKSAAEFEKQIVAIEGVGKASSFAATEGAKGIDEVVRIGADFARECLSLQKSARVARSLVALADANGVTVEDAAAIIRDARTRYGLTDTQIHHVIDVIVGAKRATPISVEDFNGG